MSNQNVNKETEARMNVKQQEVVEAQIDEQDVESTVIRKRKHKKLNPAAKWIAIGFGGAILLGVGVALIVKKAAPPAPATVEKIAETAAEVANDVAAAI